MEKLEKKTLGEEMFSYLVASFGEIVSSSLGYWSDLKNRKEQNLEIPEDKAQRMCLQHAFNVMGSRGWELVAYKDNGILIFKRKAGSKYDTSIEELGLNAEEGKDM